MSSISPLEGLPLRELSLRNSLSSRLFQREPNTAAGRGLGATTTEVRASATLLFLRSLAIQRIFTYSTIAWSGTAGFSLGLSLGRLISHASPSRRNAEIPYQFTSISYQAKP